jgi:hypothetical protein
MATLNPSAASLRAAPAPMPLPPAVTIATFSSATSLSRYPSLRRPSTAPPGSITTASPLAG